MEPLENMDELLPDFLKKTGPKTDGFRLPDGYFEKLGDRFFEKKAAPGSVFLDEIKPIGDGHSLPENYFEELPDRVFEKIGTGGNTVGLPQKRPFFNIVKNPAALAAAASMAVLVAALAFFFNKKTVEKPASIACNVSCLSEKISAEDVEFYLAENLSEFSTDELAAHDLVGEINFPTTKKHQEIELDADDAGPLLREMLDDLSAEELEDML